MTNETHPRDGVESVRLRDSPPISIVVTCGRLRLAMTAAEFERRVSLPGLAGMLQATIDSADQSSWEPTEGSKQSVLSGNANAFQKISGALAFRGKETSDVAGTPAYATPVDNNTERVAHHLASALRDQKSLAFYRLVARAVPHEVIRDALTRVLDTQDIRRSRGALFAHLVRPHLPPHQITNRHPT